MSTPKRKPGGGMTVREAGQKGGETVKRKYGPEFYEAIGRKGGEATKLAHGHEFYEQIGKKGGKKGGEATRDRYGPAFYEEIGQKGFIIALERESFQRNSSRGRRRSCDLGRDVGPRHSRSRSSALATGRSVARTDRKRSDASVRIARPLRPRRRRQFRLDSGGHDDPHASARAARRQRHNARAGGRSWIVFRRLDA